MNDEAALRMSHNCISGCGCQPSPYKEECYFYSEEHDMGASIPCCSFRGGLGNCPCENCKSYLSEQAAYRIVRAVREGKYKPVVRGEWILVVEAVFSVTYRCSHCGNYFTEHSDTLNAGRGDKNYCPNCGADMREEANDER